MPWRTVDLSAWRYGLSDQAWWVAGFGLPTATRPPEQPLGDAPWRALRDECDRHGLSGLLVGAVADGAFPVSDGQRADAARLEVELTDRRIDYERRVGRVLAWFDDAGIETRVLKGVAVARLDYSDEQLRPTGDLDVLVRADRVESAAGRLVAAGGVRADPEPAPGWSRLVGKGATVFVPEVGLEVDLHRILTWGPLGVRVPADGLWERHRTFRLADVDRSTLGLEETLLHACAHLVILGVARAREARDVAQLALAPDLDVARLGELARRWGQGSVVATALAVAGRELGLSPEVWRAFDWMAGVAAMPGVPAVARRSDGTGNSGVAGIAGAVGKAAADGLAVPWLDRWWLRAGAPDPSRVRGLEQLGVWWELGRVPEAWAARRVLMRANLRPAPGTYAGPIQRIRALVSRWCHHIGGQRRAHGGG